MARAKKPVRKPAKTAKPAKAKKSAKSAAKPRAQARKALGGELSMVTLHVHDLTRALAFYRDTLGLRAGDIIDTPDFGWAELEVTRGVKLGLHADKAGMEEGARKPGGSSGFYFAVRDVDDAIGKLVAKGVVIDEKPMDRPYGRDAYIADPDGNVIALWAPK